MKTQEEELRKSLTFAFGNLYIKHGRDAVNVEMLVDVAMPLIEAQLGAIELAKQGLLEKEQ